MGSAFDDIMEGLGQAQRHVAGESLEGIVVHVPSELDVAEIRRKSGLSQAAFAGSMGVKTNTLQQWEQKRRSPVGPARVLLALVDRDPGIVATMLGRERSSSAAPKRRAG